MGFKPSKSDPDIWMKLSKDGSHYEYIAVYVDDLAICMKDQKSFCDTLKEKYKLKLKGVGPINYHLGCGYTRDEDGTLVADPRKYVEKILESYEKTFGEKPKKSRTPHVGGDHPESYTSEFCNQDQIKHNRSLLSSGGLMADVPCLDHSLDGYKGYPDDVQTTKHARRTHGWSRCAQTSLGAHASPFGASGARF